MNLSSPFIVGYGYYEILSYLFSFFISRHTLVECHVKHVIIQKGGLFMTTGIHQVEANLPIHHVWLFVRELNNWAPLIPGYLEHKMVSERQSTWKFTGDAGFIKKTVHTSLDITEWNRPTKITFDLVGLNEKFVGKGYFEATSLSEQKTRITGCLRITAKGMIDRKSVV